MPFVVGTQIAKVVIQFIFTKRSALLIYRQKAEINNSNGVI